MLAFPNKGCPSYSIWGVLETKAYCKKYEYFLGVDEKTGVILRLPKCISYQKIVRCICTVPDKKPEKIPEKEKKIMGRKITRRTRVREWRKFVRTQRRKDEDTITRLIPLIQKDDIRPYCMPPLTFRRTLWTIIRGVFRRRKNER